MTQENVGSTVSTLTLLRNQAALLAVAIAGWDPADPAPTFKVDDPTLLTITPGPVSTEGTTTVYMIEIDPTGQKHGTTTLRVFDGAEDDADLTIIIAPVPPSINFNPANASVQPWAPSQGVGALLAAMATPVVDPTPTADLSPTADPTPTPTADSSPAPATDPTPTADSSPAPATDPVAVPVPDPTPPVMGTTDSTPAVT